MDSHHLIEGLLRWLALVILFTFHEFGHAWMAMKCGDNTARDEGRVSFNPLVHLDIIGSVVMPLVMFLSPYSAGRFLLGWARPVPVNLNNLRNPRIDDVYVTFAGPWLNVIVAVVCVGLARIGIAVGSINMTYYCFEVAEMSMMLFFFNLLPIPPLDGSRIMRVVIGMSYDTFADLSRYGYIMIILVMQARPVGMALGYLTDCCMNWIAKLFGMGL
ncbi:MAG: hypothetical protein RLY20_1786 [Verrucomicrobiota bacterium]